MQIEGYISQIMWPVLSSACEFLQYLELHNGYAFPQHQDQNQLPAPSRLFCLRDNTLVLPTRDIVQRPLEMLLGSFQARALLVSLQIRVDELNEAVKVFRGDLSGDGQYILLGIRTVGVNWIHRLVLLIEVVDISVQYLDEELY